MKPLLAENSEKLGSNSSYIIKDCAEAIQHSPASVFSSVEGLYDRPYRFTARLIDEAFPLDTKGIRGLQVSRRPEMT